MASHMRRPIFADLWLFAGFVMDFWPMKRKKKCLE